MTTASDPSLLASLVYNALVKSARRAMKRGRTSRMWWKAWDWSRSYFPGPVKTNIHGRPVILNFGNTYPLNVRLNLSYNAPLVELIHQAEKQKGSPICYVDVGAATGDSILLVHQNCPGAIGSTYCVDGDGEFIEYLRINTKGIPGCKIRQTMLSANGSGARELVRTHGGTASSQGLKSVESRTLDEAVKEDQVGPIDVLKIDVDGFDGRILMGSSEILSRDRPLVIFEWHPICCAQTSNNWTDHFRTLVDAKYDHFLWYTKFGEFSHYMKGFDAESVEITAQLCLETKAYDDLHYDIIALPAGSPHSLIEFADLRFARARRFPH